MSVSTYDRLVDSATTLFARKGFYGASIRDIADQQGISKQALLHHFASKEKLYAEVLERIATRVMKKVGEIDSNLSSLEKLATVMQQMSQLSTDDLDGARVLMRELLDNPDRAQEAVNWYLNPLLDSLVEIVEQGQVAGEFQQVSPLAFIYNLLGAQQYFMISLPTLKQMLNAKEYKSLLKNHQVELKAMMNSRLAV